MKILFGLIILLVSGLGIKYWWDNSHYQRMVRRNKKMKKKLGWDELEKDYPSFIVRAPKDKTTNDEDEE